MYGKRSCAAVRRRSRMGRMYVDIEIGRGLDGPFETLVMELDTGSDDTGLPRPFLRSLGVRPLGWDRYELADGRRVPAVWDCLPTIAWGSRRDAGHVLRTERCPRARSHRPRRVGIHH